LEATCFRPLPEAFSFLFQYKENSFVEKIAMADNQFFKVFSFPLLIGDPSTAFSNPNSVVITERMSQKYFGEEEALGKTFSITAFGQKKLLTVSGVLENIPHNSHIQSELILPIEFMNYFGVDWDVWGNYALTTYIRTQDNVSSIQLEEKILDCKEGHISQEGISYSVLPITKIHLNTSDVGFFTTTGDIKYVYLVLLRQLSYSLPA
jgi:putative ABC transport system permease protein